MDWRYVDELVYYKNMTSQIQGPENATKDKKTQLFSKKECHYIEETISFIWNRNSTINGQPSNE
ncbi:hypothetical protein E2542_SST28482 [Spatholobus suberectus]|nr:hypothetical protein E2542_SST28482 [Spatholobus suberectus]